MAAFQPPGVFFRGPYRFGDAYGLNDIVISDGRVWLCSASQTTAAPGEGSDWTYFAMAMTPKSMQTCTPDESLTQWAFPETPATLESLTLYLNGLAQDPGADFTLGPDGASAVFGTPLQVGDKVRVSYWTMGSA